jgi:type IV pilus assembly protein PilA
MKGLRICLPVALLILSACGQDASPEEEAAPASAPAAASPQPAAASPQPEPAVPAPAPQQGAQTPLAEPDDGLARAQEFVAKVQAGLALAQALKTMVEDTVERTGEIPETFDEAVTRTVPPTSSDVRSIRLTDGGSIVIDYVGQDEFPGGTIELEPMLEDGQVSWDCSGGSLPAEYRPGDCG